MFDDHRTSAVVAAAGEERPSVDELSLTHVLVALGDPVRLAIVASLARDCAEQPCKDFDLPVAKSTASHHFRVLREAGVIRQRVAGTTKMTSLRRDDLDARFPGLLDAVLAAAIRRTRAPG
jgi:DNA-binding transcriptional ArsR family regulator